MNEGRVKERKSYNRGGETGSEMGSEMRGETDGSHAWQSELRW